MIVFDVGALEDLEPILDFNIKRDSTTALQRIDRIRTAVIILDEHPLIGRPIQRGSAFRELVISHGRTGYVALYEHSPFENLVRIVAIRYQCEAGYRNH